MPLSLAPEDPAVAAARRGDPLAWADLYERFHPILERYLEIVNPGALEDMDAVWERAARSLIGQPEGIAPLPWLLRAARDGMVIRPDPDDASDPAVRAIRALAPVEMDVIALRVVAGLDESDTAFVIGRPVERVRSAAHIGLAKLLREGAAA
jgi:DNA-directed RNA polymerase specialized sigma24 family protein